MRKLLATAFAMGFLTLNSSLQAESKLTEEQKEEALARFETLQEKLSLTDEQLVEVTKTVPLEKLVWDHRKEPDNERQEIHSRTEDPHTT